VKAIIIIVTNQIGLKSILIAKKVPNESLTTQTVLTKARTVKKNVNNSYDGNKSMYLYDLCIECMV